MGAGHTIDGNTIGAWRFNTVTAEGVVADRVDDSGNGLTLVHPVATARTLVQGGPGGVTIGTGPNGEEIITDADLCMWSDRNSTLSGAAIVWLLSPGAAFLDSIRDSTWTFEAWIYVESVAYGTYQLVCRVANEAGGVGNANDEIVQVRVDNATRFLQLFWQHGNKIGVTVTASSGAVPLRTWTHVAARYVDNALDWDVELYVAGVSVGTGTGPHPQASSGDGDNADIVVARNFDNSNRFHGGIAMIAMSDIDRGAAFIAARAAESDSRRTDDGNYFGLWNMQEAPDAYDHSTNGHHLVSADENSNTMTGGFSGILGDGGFGRYMPDSGSQGWQCPKREAIRLAVSGASEWTLECWHRFRGDEVATNDSGLISYGLTGDESMAGNAQASVYVDRDGGGVDNEVRTFWENGAGANVQASGPTSWWSDAQVDEESLRHLAVVKRSLGGGNSAVDYYLDGTLVDSTPSTADPDGGDSERCRLTVLRSEGGADRPLMGYVDDARLSSVERTSVEIQASFDAGIAAAAGAADTTAPVLTLVSPPTSAPIPAGATITATITDDSGTVLNPVLYAVVAGRWEVVHDGSGFGPGYNGTRTVIASGFQWDVSRSGSGWPDGLTLVARAVDSAGNLVEVA